MADPQLNRVARRLLHLSFWLTRGLTLGVRAAAIDAEERVCLVRHTYVEGWHLPGGGIEVGETALEALRRELSEEAALALTGTPRLHGLYFNRHASRRDHVALYVVREFGVVAEKVPDREIAEAKFFPLSHLPEGTSLGTRRRLEEIASGSLADPLW
jgi:8-oxo-dGTP pyrophosphatase MutT (NUDIX family)